MLFLLTLTRNPKSGLKCPIYPFHKMESQAGSPGLHSKERMKKRVESIIGDQQSQRGVGWDMCLLGLTLKQHSRSDYYSSAVHVQKVTVQARTPC